MNRVSIGRHCCAQSTHLGAYAGVVAGDAGREHVRSHYLLPRLVRDTLAHVRFLVAGSR